MKKILALVLALTLLVTVSLSAVADSAYDSYVIGTWSGYARLDTTNNDVTASGTTTLTMNSDGSCSWYFAGMNMTGTWQYVSTESSGYGYSMTVSVEGTDRTFAVMFATTSSLYGSLAVLVGDAIYLYQK